MLLVSSASLCSATALAQPITLTSSTSSTARAQQIESLFGFDLTLNPSVFFEGTDREHVAFPTREAEALLDIFEKRIPNMKRLIEQQDALIGIQDDQIAVLERSLVLTSSNAADALMIAEKWKEAAQAQAESNFWDDLFESPYFWSVALVVGAAGGAGIYAVIDKLDGSLD